MEPATPYDYGEILGDRFQDLVGEEVVPCDPEVLARMKEVIMRRITYTPQNTGND